MFSKANSEFSELLEGSTTTAADNVAVGSTALAVSTTGTRNTAVGPGYAKGAGKALTTGTDNVFMGVDAGGSNTTASNNTFVGGSAGCLNSTASQNTGIGLALISLIRGYKCLIVVPDKMAEEKIIHQKALGAEVVITRSDVEKGHPEYYADLAEKITKERGAFYINQFSNEANVNAHFEWTGPEIINQLGGQIDAFCAGVGTGGTLTGVGKALKKINNNCDLILADPTGSILEPLFRTGKKPKTVGSWIVEGIGEDYVPPLLEFNLISHAYSIPDKEAINTCNELLKKEGILAGSSSGTLIAAAIRYCKEQQSAKNVVTLVCDTGNKYLKIFDNE